MKNSDQDIRPVDELINKYSESRQNPTNKLIHWICVPLVVFSLLGLIWAVPFPHLDFLGKFNGFINWASFVIAFSIYYYLRLSPVLSYAMLLLVFFFSGIIVWLEKLHTQNNWPQMWVVCLVIFALASVGQFIGHTIEGRKSSLISCVKFLLIGPIWLFHFVCKRAGIRY